MSSDLVMRPDFCSRWQQAPMHGCDAKGPLAQMHACCIRRGMASSTLQVEMALSPEVRAGSQDVTSWFGGAVNLLTLMPGMQQAAGKALSRRTA